MMQKKLKTCNKCSLPKLIWKKEGRERYCQSCWNEIKPTVPKHKPVQIKKISDKQSKLNTAYSVLRKSFLSTNPYCQARLSCICSINATDVHHMEGRGVKTLDTTTWLAVCRLCHCWIEEHPLQAKELNLSKSRERKNAKDNLNEDN